MTELELMTLYAEQLRDERDAYLSLLDDERAESARLRQHVDDVMRSGDMEHNRNVALLERAERAEAEYQQCAAYARRVEWQRDQLRAGQAAYNMYVAGRLFRYYGGFPYPPTA